MLKDNEKVFDVYVLENGFTTNKIAVMKGVYKKLSRWEIVKSKDLRKSTKEEIISLCQEGSSKIANRSYGAMKTRVDSINEILKWLQADVKLSMTDFNTEEILTDDKIRYFTREEIQDVCELFINQQDKFIVYGIFCGVYGKGYSDLLELEVKDVDLEKSTITMPSGKIIVMDKYLLDVARNTIDPDGGSIYNKYMSEGTKDSTTNEYKLIMRSKYVLKPKPYSKNNDGLYPMKINGMQRRLNKLSEIAEVTLSGTDIYRSGIMDRMYAEEGKTGRAWTCASLETWLKKNEIKAQVFELYRIYKDKYNKSENQPAS